MADPWSAAAGAGIGVVGNLVGGLLQLGEAKKKRRQELEMAALQAEQDAMTGSANTQADRQAQALAQMMNVYGNVLNRY